MRKDEAIRRRNRVFRSAIQLMMRNVTAFIKCLVPNRILGIVRERRRQAQLRSFQPREVTHIYAERSLTIFLADRLAETWYDCDWAEPEEIRELRVGKLRPNAKVLEAGAHQGIVAMLLAECIGETGTVIAVELIEHNVQVARRNALRNGYHNIVCLHAAIGETSGIVKANLNFNGQLGTKEASAFTTQVPMMTVDEIAAERGCPDVLYLDVEGYELNALKGATNTLASNPDCFVEVHVGCGLEKFGGDVDSLLKMFPASRYDIMVGRQGSALQSLASCPPEVMTERFYLIARAR